MVCRSVGWSVVDAFRAIHVSHFHAIGVGGCESFCRYFETGLYSHPLISTENFAQNLVLGKMGEEEKMTKKAKKKTTKKKGQRKSQEQVSRAVLIHREYGTRGSHALGSDCEHSSS